MIGGVLGATAISTEYAACLKNISAIDPSRCASVYDLKRDGEALLVPFYEKIYRISNSHIIDLDDESPTDAVGLVLCRYLINCPSQPLPVGGRITFRELKSAGPLVSSFATNTNKLITGAFASDPEALERAGHRLNGQKQSENQGFDLVMVFNALPRIRLYLQFNAAETPFPAQCGILFDRSAETYLDMQSLFILGTYLAGGLVQNDSSDNSITIPLP